MNNRRPVFVFLALLLSATCRAAVPPAPSPEALLDSVLKRPDVSYRGRMTVVGRQDQGGLPEEVDVSFAPPNRYRWEFLKADGSRSRLVMSDGKDEYVQETDAKKILKGGAVRSEEKLLSPQDEKALLVRNYKYSSPPSEAVARREAWVLVLSPIAADKPEQRFWIDQKTGVVLKVARTFSNGRYVISSYFTTFDPEWAPKDDEFQWKDNGGEIKEHELYPDFLTMEELNKSTGNNWSPAKELPDGFIFESADYYGPQKNTILHWRYTDGLAVVSLFRTDRAIGVPKGGGKQILSQEPLPDSFRLSGTIHSYTWKKGPYHYTLMSDLSRPILKKIAATLE